MRARWTLAAACAALTIPVSCGSDGGPEKGLTAAVSSLLDTSTIAARFELRVGGEVLGTGTEVLQTDNGWSDLTLDGVDHQIHLRPPSMVLIDGPEAREFTGGRLLAVEPDELTREEYLSIPSIGELSDVLSKGLIQRYVAALASPESVSTIGRAVTAQKATTHFLVDSRIGGVAQAIEVWVSDDEELVQIRYLTTGSVGEVVEAEMVFVDPPRFGVVNLDISSAVTVAHVEEEERRAVEAAEEAERERERAEKEAEARARDRHDELTDEWLDTLLAWLASDWQGSSDDSLPPGQRFTPDGLLCSDTSPRMGIETYITCHSVPSAEDLAPVCAAAESLLTSLRNDSDLGAWADSADAFLAAAMRADLRASTGVSIEYLYETDEFLVMSRWDADDQEADAPDPQPFLAGSAEWLADLVREGLFMNGEYLLHLTTAPIEAMCDVRFEFPDVLMRPLEHPTTPVVDTTPSHTGGDPLSAHLPMRRGDSGDHVAELQRLLIAVGLPVGSSGADGHFGPSTEGAVGQFQYSYGLDTTQVVDHETLHWLRHLAANPEDPTRCPDRDIVVADMTMGGEGDSRWAELEVLHCWTRPMSATNVVVRVPSESAVPGYALLIEGHVWWRELVSAPTQEALCAEVVLQHQGNDRPGSGEDAIAGLGC